MALNELLGSIKRWEFIDLTSLWRDGPAQGDVYDYDVNKGLL